MKCEQILVSMMYIRVEEPTSKSTKNQWQTYHGVWYHQFKISRKRSKSTVFYVAKTNFGSIGNVIAVVSTTAKYG